MNFKKIVDTSFKLTSLVFWTKFAQKECFWFETEKVNSVIEFYIFELV